MPLRPPGLAALLLVLLPAAGAVPAETPPAAPEKPSLRGAGVVIVDPLDSPEEVRERLRQFVLEVRANVPPEKQREEVRRQVDALLSTPPGPDAQIPQISIVFQPGMTAAQILSYMDHTPSARASREVCPVACPVAALYRDGMHVHLTRPHGGAGDSVFALAFEGPAGASGGVEQAAERRQSLLERYPIGADARRPVGTIFGVGVFLGEAVAPESSRLPE
jgi:hypothetical protein